MKLPELKIGTKIAKVPIVQGGMAIRLSTARLAAAVANEGGIGLIAASGMSHEELRYEIRLARSLTSGIIGINIMVAARDFAGVVKTAIKEGIDLIVAGAGFSRDMFGYGKESGTPIVPIVSSVKLAKISERLGATAIVVEGKEAGGHLGTSTSVRELIPGIRAGKPTERYLSFVLSRLTAPGSLYLAVLAMIPVIALMLLGSAQEFPFGGVSILIIVGVGLDTVKQIQSQLQQRNYEGFLR